MAEKHLRKLPTIDLSTVVTPWNQAVCVEIGPVSADSLLDLQSGGFDQAPVLSKGLPVGLVPTARLKLLATTGESLKRDDSAIVITSLPASPNLGEALIAAEQHGMASVGLGVAGPSTGFYTVADLNKHPVRALIYPLFAELESRLAQKTAQHFDDPWLWLDKLDKEKQARLVGYWEMGKRANVDVGPLAGTTLSELSAIVAKTDTLRLSLGFTSRGKWDDFFGSLVDLRNAVMHPVRPLFLSKEIVAVVHEQLTRVLTLLDRLDGDNANGVGSNP